MKQKTFLNIATVLLLATVSLALSGCLKNRNLQKQYKITLEVWGVFDDSDALAKISGKYRETNPHVQQIQYKKISPNPEDYEKELIDAFASGKGPDIVFFKSAWLPKHGDKVVPLPESEAGIASFKNSFIDVAYEDFVKDSQIYAMPLYNDTLALYYNKDLLNQSGISAPPKTWSEVRDQTKLITKIDQYGNITRSAIALGRSREPGAINRSSDILVLMMMQGGAKMNHDNGSAGFSDSLNGTDKPGENALDFYSQFSQANSEAYTWNSKMDYSIDSFRYGRVAMMINYSYWKDRLKKMDPKLNFDVAPVPQLDPENKVNYGIYWGLAVAKNKQLPQDAEYTNDERIKEAWNYIKFATMPPDQGASFDPAETYLDITGKPSARRDLVEKQKNDAFLGVFANQALTAKTWKQPDDLAVEEIFVEMINEVNSGLSSTRGALETAVSRFNVLVKK